MPQGFKDKWKAAKNLLKDHKLDPKIKKSERVTLYFGHFSKISTLFGNLDEALDKKQTDKARKIFSELKEKVNAYILSADKLFKELQKDEPKSAEIIQKAIRQIQMLIMVARADVVELKDVNKIDHEVGQEKLQEWIGKLKEMVRHCSNEVTSKLQSLKISGEGLAEQFERMNTELVERGVKSEKIKKIKKELDIQKLKLFGEVKRLEEVRTAKATLIPALKKYVERKGIEAAAKEPKYIEATGMVNGVDQLFNDGKEALNLAKTALAKTEKAYQEYQLN